MPSSPASKVGAAPPQAAAPISPLTRPRRVRGEPPDDKGTFSKVSSLTYRDRRLKAAMPFINLIVGYAAGKGGFTDEWQEHLADELGVTSRTIRRYQDICADCEVILTIRHGKKNRYVVLPRAVPAPRRPDREKNKADKIVRPTRSESKPKRVLLRSSPPLPPSPLAGRGCSDGAPGRRAEAMRGALARRRHIPPSPAELAGDEEPLPSAACREIRAHPLTSEPWEPP